MRRLITVAFFLLALLPSGFVFWHAREAPHLGAFQDDSLYVTTAKSLAEGRGYRILSLPGEPYMTKYPPLYPLLLSLVWRLDSHFPQNLRWMMLFQWLLWILFLTTLWLTIRSLADSGDTIIFPTLLLVATAPAFIYLSVSIMAESLFASFVLASLITLGHDQQTKPTRAFWAGCAAGAAFLTKSAALPLVAAGILTLATRKRWISALLYGIPSIGAVLAWWHWSRLHRYMTRDINLLYYVDYLEFYRRTTSLADLFSLLNANLAALLETTGRLVAFTEHQWRAARVALVLLGIAVVYFASVSIIRNKSSYIRCFSLLYVAQSLLWNYPPNERFMFPLLPFVIFGFLVGSKDAIETVTKNSNTRKAWHGMCVLIIAWSVGKSIVYLPNFVYAQNAAQRRIACFADWARSRLKERGPVLGYRDVDLYLYSKIQGVRLQPLPSAYYRNDRSAAYALLGSAPDYAHRMGLQYMIWDADDYYNDPFLKDFEARKRILQGMRGIRFEGQSCGVQLYRFGR